MSALQLNPLTSSPRSTSCCVRVPDRPDSGLSPDRQCASGMEALANDGARMISRPAAQRINVFMWPLESDASLAERPLRAVEGSSRGASAQHSGNIRIDEGVRPPTID